ncbi:sensor histidine kinase [Lysobacter enzymogenes]|uniref:sensor histidine kinase n=1 Tax=Lysobacter enzymogenes TaxID=69 RepID=UPI00089595F3|nr:histidine kinase [Lysobacter enzymogenes]SDW66532.1 Histidine kinase [Lysobacter enzymogenes]
MRLRLPPLWLLVLLWWIAYAVVYAGQVLSMSEASGHPEPFAKILVDSLSIWLTWVPITLGLVWVVRRWPIEPGRIGRALAIQSLAVLAAVLLRAAHMYFTNSIHVWFEVLPDFATVALMSLRNNVMMAWMIVAAAHAVVLSERMRERERRLLQVEAHLARSRLEALSAKLHPHFLFNTLNSIAELVHSDPDVAEDVLVGLAELLHDSLDADQAPLRPLRAEAELIRTYLGIEQLRLGERLQTQWALDDDALDLPVPTLLLLPLVENAIVHAIARRREPGLLSVRATRENGRLIIEVANPLAAGGSAPGSGLGLGTTRERLRWLYAEAATLEHGPTPDGRHLVRVGLPLTRPANAADPAPAP